MDNISINQAGIIYWLGRYTERAYTLINYVRKYYDRMVDLDINAYSEFCSRLGITDKYDDKNDFVKRFISDKEEYASIAYALNKTYDNAVVLRDKLSSRTLCYIQMAFNDLSRNFDKECKIINLQRVTDDLTAFWGAVDDYIVEENVRNLIKAGKYTERIELYKRFDEESSKINNAADRLSFYITQLGIGSSFSNVNSLVAADGESHYDLVEGYNNRLFGTEAGQ